MRLEAFAGDWRLDRVIEDALAGRQGRFTGQARFRPGPDGLDYAEEGTLTLGDAPPMTARRDYRWSADASDGIEVRFADGRFFHRFPADDPTPEALHDCDPDQYHVRYDFRAWPRWTAEWRVRGPRKDYLLVSTYQPAPHDWPAGQGPGIGA